jgi:hypothetical protein
MAHVVSLPNMSTSRFEDAGARRYPTLRRELWGRHVPSDIHQAEGGVRVHWRGTCPSIGRGWVPLLGELELEARSTRPAGWMAGPHLSICVLWASRGGAGACLHQCLRHVRFLQCDSGPPNFRSWLEIKDLASLTSFALLDEALAGRSNTRPHPAAR